MDDKYSTLLSVRRLKLYVNYVKQSCVLHSPPSEGLGEVPNQLCLERSATCDRDVIFTLVCGCSSRYFVGDKYSTLLSVRRLKLYINYGNQACFLHSPP